MEETKPHFASSQNVHIDEAYASWIEELKGRYKKAQIKSAVKVNSEQLLFNWQLGRDLVVRRAEEHWGAGVVEQVSLDLKAAFPKAKGFSTTNLWNMKKWYLFYSTNKANEKLHQLGGELQNSDNKLNRNCNNLVQKFKKPNIPQKWDLLFLLFFLSYLGGIMLKSLPRAITIHRSQEMTFERMHFDLSHGTFLPGQAYVAISRLRSLEGLTLGNPIHPYHVTQNQEVRVFANSYNDTE